MEKEEYQLKVNKYESRMKEAPSYSAQHSWTLPKQLLNSPFSIIQVLWGTFFATNHPGKCFDPLKVKKMSTKKVCHQHSRQAFTIPPLNTWICHYVALPAELGGLFGYCPTRQGVFFMIGLPYDKMQAHQANIQKVGANCSKSLPLFGNICLSLMFSVIALCVVGSHCGVYRKRICPPALPALDTIVSNQTNI